MPRRAPADEESFGRAAVPPANPYAGPGPDMNASGNIWIDRGRRLAYIGVSSWILQRVSFFGAVLHSPHIRHEWFKLGIGTTIGTYLV